MQIYTVGGYVRDKLMGLEPKDCDYVVVGSTPEEMVSLGYEQVGKDFPVFLHPKTGDEYALARTERKTGVGYNGFDVETKNVTLEEDLFRRDLTINAMALDQHGNLIDPYGGKQDIKNKILRHVSIHFKEDPVRILRIARFSARYNFSVAPETLSLMREMVDNGEFDHLTGERVWKEFEKVLSEKHINNFFNALENISALEKVPGFSSISEKEFFDYIVEQNLPNNFTLNFLHTFSNMNNQALKNWKMPSDLIQKVSQFNSWKNKKGFFQFLSNDDKLSFIQQTKAIHDTNIAHELIFSIRTYQNWKNKENLDFEADIFDLQQALNKVKDLNYEDIVKQALRNKEKPNEAVKKAQLAVLENKPTMRM